VSPGVRAPLRGLSAEEATALEAALAELGVIGAPVLP
jgi:hypothetical protein